MALTEFVGTLEDFEFTRGHRRLLMVVAKFVKTTVDTSGVDGFPLPITKTKRNNKNTDSIDRNHNNNIGKTAEDRAEDGLGDVKLYDCQLHSSASAQSDRPDCKSASTYYFNFCSLHVLAQMLARQKVLSDQIENCSCILKCTCMYNLHYV